MAIVWKQLFFLYIFILLGYLFGKWKKDLRRQTGMLSFLAVNLFLPAKVFRTFSTHFTPAYFRENYILILVSVSLLLVLHLLGKLIGKLLKGSEDDRGIIEYSVTISNYAYMGYALAEGLFGSQALTDMILFCIPFSLYTYTVGYVKLTGSEVSAKRLINPMTGAIVLGCAAGLSGMTLPELCGSVIDSAAACVGPVSMLLTGLTLSCFCLRNMMTDKRVYLLTAIRLVALPVLVQVVFRLLSLEELLPSALLMAAMPTGLNTIIFPENAGKSPELGAKLAFLSHAFSCITLPIWIGGYL